MVPIGGSINQEMNKIKVILSNKELGEMKGEKPNDTILEDRFLKVKAYCYTTVKSEEEKKQRE